MAWQATIVIIIYAVFFEKTADISATKMFSIIFEYDGYFVQSVPFLEFVFRREQYGKLDGHFIQDWKFKI